jgi:hypothetical protein
MPMSDSDSRQGKDIQITFNADGEITIHGISMLEELWDDYHFFKQQALETSPQDNLILYKRYVRAALLALFNYLEGILNKWVVELEPSTNLRSLQTVDKISIVSKNIRKKLKQDKSVGWLEISKTKYLRNAISHLKPGEDQFAMFQSLISESFFNDADRIIKWIEITKNVLGLETHPNMGKSISDFANELGLSTDHDETEDSKAIEICGI